MKKLLKIERSLISVSDKKGIVSLAKKLVKNNIKIISTGNTYNKLLASGVKSFKVQNITNFPEILEGRVKTLHPSIFGGILGNIKVPTHLKQMRKYGISKIELVIVNLYPFEKTITTSTNFEECIEKIDVGGPAMIRAAAKNFLYTVILVDSNDYKLVLDDITKYNGVTLETRRLLAEKAFKRTMAYDIAIYNWLNNKGGKESQTFLLKGMNINTLRYGENPHQKAEIYSTEKNNNKLFYKKLSGKELSFNNLNDLNSGLSLLAEFKDPAAVIIKHAIPCGVSENKNMLTAWVRALNADKLSAFGGVVVLNRLVDEKLAKALNVIFLEVIAAVGFTNEAFRILSKKQNLRILKINDLKEFRLKEQRKIIMMPNSFLVQDKDLNLVSKNELRVVTKRKPKKKELVDLIFAEKVVKHVRSNAIVIARDSTTVGIGSGNTSRVDSVNFAINKSLRYNTSNSKKPKKLKGLTMASDAFFPFSDSILLAKKAGIEAIIQPGGSINDKDVIENTNKANITMVFCSKRSFSH